MPIRSLIASLIIAGLIAGGGIYVMAREHASLADFIALLQMRSPNATFVCSILAWAATVAAALAVLTGFAAFLDEPDDDDYRRRGFPKGLPIALLIIALVLFWAALACMDRTAQQRVVIPIEPAAASVEPLAGAEAADELAGASTDEAPADPDAGLSREADQKIMAYETALIWEYKYPLISGETYIYSPGMSDAIAALFPAGDPNGDVRAMLCGKAWVAFTGSASEEGPRDRNERRARRRAEMAAGAASDWLDLHEDCQRPVILAVTLGQHAGTTVPLADGGRSTGYQRQTLVASRELARDERIDRASAVRELDAYLDDAESLEALLGGRRYLSPPAVFTPGS